MDKIQLGSSDLRVSPISLGCMSLGTDLTKASNIIDEALDLGINYLDTADLYDSGQNEEIIGQTIKNKRDQFILATKVGNHLKYDGSWFWDPRKAYIKEQVKESLRRLQVDYIDLYQLHGGTIEDPIEQTIEAFDELVSEGTIRYYGISSIRPNVIREYVMKSKIVSVMMQYSILDRRPEEEMLDLLHQNHISVVTRGSLAKGILSKKGVEIAKQKGQKGYLDYQPDHLIEVVNKLNEILNKGQTLTGLALQYVAQNDAVSSIVSGASSMDQIKENVNALEQNFDQKQFDQVKEITRANTYQQHR
ncbi:oxidoreductase [Gracilibacillus boraciitolerans JCM 21714]|uniref:Oxidoreductase n=1 Tax=Gracilibacillus boraciitolerans JCM 21714 TaxID=1298598 RepID=W4VDK3_9BACI|nr:aldo/keto reductase [Gracilibacillus boraciitolerans]GAE91292.1 oxidoreductase [Gracilibacillus boraciitolerans JCM 21714]